MATTTETHSTAVDEAEILEATALGALHDSADPTSRAALGLSWHRFGAVRASMATSLPASAIVINRALCFAPNEPRSTVEDVVAAYRAAGIERFFVSVPEAQGAACEAAGLLPARAWQKFERSPGMPLPEVRDLVIRDVSRDGSPDLAAAFAEIACDAFDLGPQARPWIARLPAAANWQAYMAFIDGAPAGTGALYLGDGIAWLDWGATAPAFRRRGVQRALLAHRVTVADRLGLARVYTCTGTPTPGDPQHSYHNILRCGFRETQVRLNFAPPRDASAGRGRG